MVIKSMVRGPCMANVVWEEQANGPEGAYCRVTIVICIISAFHDDIPRTRRPAEDNQHQRFLKALRGVVKWMIIFLLLRKVFSFVTAE